MFSRLRVVIFAVAISLTSLLASAADEKTLTYKITDDVITELKKKKVPKEVTDKLKPMTGKKDQPFGEFSKEITDILADKDLAIKDEDKIKYLNEIWAASVM